MLARVFRITAALILLAGRCLSQQRPSFSVQTNLVTVPFQVRRGSRSVDVKPSDVVLLEDGVRRSFTIFEAPPSHLTLDLLVMFDVSNPRPGGKIGRVGFWDGKALANMADYWSEAAAHRLLDEKGVTIRFSIYRFDQSRLRRLCQATGDSKVLSDALRGLVTDEGVEIPLPAGLKIRAPEREAQAHGYPPQPWSLAGALSVLGDSGLLPLPNSGSSDPETSDAVRAFVIFSNGAEGTSVTPHDLANRATAAGVPIYPVALSDPRVPILAYDGYGSEGNFWCYCFQAVGLSMWGPSGPYTPPWGPADRPTLPANAPPVAPYFNYPFELLGDLTGGLHFEAANHSQPLGDSGQRFVADAMHPAVVTMSGAETEDILARVKRHALSRFSSMYTVGFVPMPSESPRGHKLEVKLAPKTSGKVIEGQRNAIY